MIRLQKLMAQQGIASRRKCEEFIQAGIVRVNGKVIKELGVQVDPENDRIQVDDMKVRKLTNYVYVLLNKPKGVVTTTSNHEGRNVIDLVQIKKHRIFPVGRLDKDSSGLLILTDDGELANKLMHPKYQKEKEYSIRLEKPHTPALINKLKNGVHIDRKKRIPLEISTKGKMKMQMVINEGANRQVRRMIARCGNEVKDLKRQPYSFFAISNRSNYKPRVCREPAL